MQLNDNSIESNIPYYLTQEAKLGLIRALKDFPEKTNYYTNLYPHEMLQGDGIRSLYVINFADGERKAIKGVLLSNSCDMDANNNREFPVKITFAPLIELNKYIILLQRAGISQSKIDDKIRSIKEQKVSYLFYLPKKTAVIEDSIAVLSDLHSIPLSSVEKTEVSAKLFTLSQVGFYLFLFKLSIHFCRFHENVER